VFWCTADVGWVTGHSYITTVRLRSGHRGDVRGIPTYPDAGRFWKIIQDHKVNVFYTAPTAIRSLIKAGGDLRRSTNLSSLRILAPSASRSILRPGCGTTKRRRWPLSDRRYLVADRDRRPHDFAVPARYRPSRIGDAALPGIIADIVDETATRSAGARAASW